MNKTRAKLLAPAGGPEAGYAAFRHGADAVYCGLRNFSARAEAVNFSADELRELIHFAHVQPRRREVFVTLNTLVDLTYAWVDPRLRGRAAGGGA